MRIFKIWVQHSKELNIFGNKQLSKIFGGSNLSEADAVNDAEKRFERANKVINGELPKDSEYEANIIEEIIHKIDDDNIVTRNRYGALVLNSKNLMFIDVDEYTKSFFQKLFGSLASTKQLMFNNIEKTAQKSAYANFGFRIYETFRGYRILVTNKSFKPNSKEAKNLMKDFNSDKLYGWLCIKQNCYRARLTPKPYRIKQKAIKVIYPFRDAEQQETLANWIGEYEFKSQKYSTCKLVKQIGQNKPHSAIEYHDKLTGIRSPLKLA